MTHWDTIVHERDKLRAEVERLNKDREAYFLNNLEMKAEIEQLRALLQRCRPYIASTSKALAGLIETALEPKP